MTVGIAKPAAAAGLFLFTDVMLDLLGEPRDLDIAVGIVGLAPIRSEIRTFALSCSTWASCMRSSSSISSRQAG